MSKKGKKSEYYVDKQEFYQELKDCRERGKMSNKLGKMFMLVSEKFSTHRFYVRYSYRDELIASGTLACCAAFEKYDLTRDNPHAYFTQVVYSAFMQVLNKEKKQRDLRDILLLEYGKNPSETFLEEQKNNIFKDE